MKEIFQVENGEIKILRALDASEVDKDSLATLPPRSHYDAFLSHAKKGCFSQHLKPLVDECLSTMADTLKSYQSYSGRGDFAAESSDSS